MNLVVGSCFRNSIGRHLALYQSRIAALHRHCDERGIFLHLLLVYGDCADATGDELRRWQPSVQDVKVIERNHGFPNYGSSEHPDRLKGFAYAANGVFEHVGAGADWVVYVESDLLWEPETLLTAVWDLTPGVDVVGVPTFCNAEVFYDIWGWRTPDGRRFGPFPPYWDALNHRGLTEVGTVGGFVAMRGEVARQCRCSAEEAIVGFCKDARSKGYRIWGDWRLRVLHP